MASGRPVPRSRRARCARRAVRRTIRDDRRRSRRFAGHSSRGWRRRQSVHFHLGQRSHAPARTCEAVEHLPASAGGVDFRPRLRGLRRRAACAVRRRWLPWTGCARPSRRRRAQFRSSRVWLENGRFVTDASTAWPSAARRQRTGRRSLSYLRRWPHQSRARRRPWFHPLLRFRTRTGPPPHDHLRTDLMTDDILGRVELPEDVSSGDVLVWMNAGAYHLPGRHGSRTVCAIRLGRRGSRQMSLAREREHPRVGRAVDDAPS